MKTILKEGKKEFTAICSTCGCEFKYQLSDIDINSVICPCCDHYVIHPNQSRMNKHDLLHPTMLCPYLFPNSDSTTVDSTYEKYE